MKEFRSPHKGRQVDIRNHRKEPDEGDAPEEEHEAVLQFSGELHAENIGHNEARGHNGGEHHVGYRQVVAKREEKRSEVVTESERFAPRHCDKRNDEVPAREHSGRTSKTKRCELVGAARVRKRGSHFRV